MGSSSLHFDVATNLLLGDFEQMCPVWDLSEYIFTAVNGYAKSLAEMAKNDGVEDPHLVEKEKKLRDLSILLY